MRVAARLFGQTALVGAISSAGVALGLSLTVPSAVASAAQPHVLTSPPTVLASTWQPTTAHDSTSSTEYQNNNVSCVSSTFCMSVGYNTHSLSPFGEEWNGSSWNEVTTPGPPGVDFSTLRGVSCVSPSFCEAVGAYNQTNTSADELFADIWNGSSWSLQTITAIPGNTSSDFEAVSCVSTTFCVGTGYAELGAPSVALTEFWNGATWTYVAASSANGSQFNGVSCSSPTWCSAVGDDFSGSTDTAIAATWNGLAWAAAPSSAPPSTPNSYLESVSCTGPTFCAATGNGYVTENDGNSYTTLMETWNGSSWSVTPSPNLGTGQGNFMTGVSCFAATSCSAVGSYYTDTSGNYYQNEAFTWNGSSWASVSTANYANTPSGGPQAGLNGVDCLSDWACMAVGYATSSSGTFAYNILAPVARSGYRFVASDGGVFNYGAGAPFLGSLGGTHLNAPIVGLGTMPAGDGYYLVASDGGVFAYGSAQFYGSMGGKPLNKPIVGMAVTPDGGGYWLVASDGGVFAFGDANFYGSAGSLPLNKPVVGIASSPNGLGYWIVASDGGIFNYGPNAPFLGSTGGTKLNKPVVGLGATTSGQYYLVASDGGIFSFPTGPSGPPFYGSTGAITLNKPIVGMTTVQGGYYLSGSDGGIFAFPTGANGLPFYGSTGSIKLNAPIVGVAS